MENEVKELRLVDDIKWQSRFRNCFLESFLHNKEKCIVQSIDIHQTIVHTDFMTIPSIMFTIFPGGEVQFRECARFKMESISTNTNWQQSEILEMMFSVALECYLRIKIECESEYELCPKITTEKDLWDFYERLPLIHSERAQQADKYFKIGEITFILDLHPWEYIVRNKSIIMILRWIDENKKIVKILKTLHEFCVITEDGKYAVFEGQKGKLSIENIPQEISLKDFMEYVLGKRETLVLPSTPECNWKPFTEKSSKILQRFLFFLFRDYSIDVENGKFFDIIKVNGENICSVWHKEDEERKVIFKRNSGSLVCPLHSVVDSNMMDILQAISLEYYYNLKRKRASIEEKMTMKTEHGLLAFYSRIKERENELLYMVKRGIWQNYHVEKNNHLITIYVNQQNTCVIATRSNYVQFTDCVCIKIKDDIREDKDLKILTKLYCVSIECNLRIQTKCTSYEKIKEIAKENDLWDFYERLPLIHNERAQQAEKYLKIGEITFILDLHPWEYVIQKDSIKWIYTSKTLHEICTISQDGKSLRIYTVSNGYKNIENRTREYSLRNFFYAIVGAIPEFNFKEIKESERKHRVLISLQEFVSQVEKDKIEKLKLEKESRIWAWQFCIKWSREYLKDFTKHIYYKIKHQIMSDSIYIQVDQDKMYFHIDQLEHEMQHIAIYGYGWMKKEQKFCSFRTPLFNDDKHIKNTPKEVVNICDVIFLALYDCYKKGNLSYKDTNIKTEEEFLSLYISLKMSFDQEFKLYESRQQRILEWEFYINESSKYLKEISNIFINYFIRVATEDNVTEIIVNNKYVCRATEKNDAIRVNFMGHDEMTSKCTITLFDKSNYILSILQVISLECYYRLEYNPVSYQEIKKIYTEKDLLDFYKSIKSAKHKEDDYKYIEIECENKI